MQVKLVVIAGASKSGEITVKPPMTLGRSRDANLTLRHALISRKHCEIAESNGAIIVRDLGSLNGTFIGGERISEAPLKHGDELTVGSVTFRVDMSAAGVSAPVGPVPQGVDPATGLEFLEPVDAVETVPIEQFEAQQQSSKAELSGIMIGGTPEQPPQEETILPMAPAQPAAAPQSAEQPAPADELSFDLNEDTPDADDSALGSFLKKL